MTPIKYLIRYKEVYDECFVDTGNHKYLPGLSFILPLIYKDIFIRVEFSYLGLINIWIGNPIINLVELRIIQNLDFTKLDHFIKDIFTKAYIKYEQDPDNFKTITSI